MTKKKLSTLELHIKKLAVLAMDKFAAKNDLRDIASVSEAVSAAAELT